jgi:ribosome biogenesis GTPase
MEFSSVDLGWRPFFEQQLSPSESENLVAARVIAHFGSQFMVLTTDGERSLPIQLANVCENLTVGDWVLVEPETYRVVRQLERQSAIGRKAAGTAIREQMIAANVDTIFIVSSCNQDFNPSRLERYLALTLEADVTPVVVLTKADLCENPTELRHIAERLHPGLLVEVIDARDPNQVEVLSPWCRTGKTVAVVGSSGVGKSTLANSLGAGSILTASIRESDAKGRHTTTSRAMHRLDQGGWLLDTPGMRELQIADCESGIEELFDEILELATHCRFRDCSHRDDDGCAVRAAVETGQLEPRRLVNYLKLQSEQARNAQSLMERRQLERKFGKMCKSIMSHKRNSRDLK